MRNFDPDTVRELSKAIHQIGNRLAAIYSYKNTRYFGWSITEGEDTIDLEFSDTNSWYIYIPISELSNLQEWADAKYNDLLEASQECKVRYLERERQQEELKRKLRQQQYLRLKEEFEQT